MSFLERDNENNRLTSIAEQFAGWMPIRVERRQNQPFFVRYYSGAPIDRIFFDEIIESEFRFPFNLLIPALTGIDVSEQCYAVRPGLPPDGFIFHMSRCGSTLVSQMLAALPQNVVISEASPLDRMICVRARRPEFTDAERVSRIRWIISALGQNRTAGAEHFFIKLGVPKACRSITADPKFIFNIFKFDCFGVIG